MKRNEYTTKICIDHTQFRKGRQEQAWIWHDQQPVVYWYDRSDLQWFNMYSKETNDLMRNRRCKIIGDE